MSDTMPPLTLALIGAGGIADTYVDAVQGMDNVQVIAVVDVRRDVADRLAARLGCLALHSYKAVSFLDVDAVVICTPPVTHPEIALHFLSRGVAVLCEKPLAIDTQSAAEMVGMAERSGVRLMVASKFRYVGDVVRAARILRSGRIGAVIRFEAAFTSRIDMSNRWNSDPDISGGGVLIDNGTHAVDLVRYFLGPIAQVMAVEGKRAQGLAVEDNVCVLFRSADDVVGTIDLSWSIDKSLEHYVQIFGTRGEIRVGWRESSVRYAWEDEWESFGRGYHKLESIAAQLGEFCQEVRGERLGALTADDALASVQVIESAYRSLRSDHWVPVNVGPSDMVGRSVGS